MQDRFSAQLLPNLARHSTSRENENRPEIRLKDIQCRIDAPFIRDNDANRIRGLPAGDSLRAQVRIGNSQTSVVALESGVTNKNGITKSALPDQMKLVLARGEIDGATILGGEFTVHRHCES